MSVTPSPTSFPRQHARTRRFSLGVPRAVLAGVAVGGPVVLFLRSDAGDDPVTHLWRHDPRHGTTEKLVDARELLGRDEGSEDLPAEERARRERAREQAEGIVGYTVDDAFGVAAFTLSGTLYTVSIATGHLAAQPTVGASFDPRVSPDGTRVAYHASGGLHVVSLPDGPSVAGRTHELVVEDGVSWGRAEFVAAEEMGRGRGFWWSGDGNALAVARVDESAVPRWTIADPARPWAAPATHSYPAAGTTNADVSLWVVDAHTGARTEVIWDRDRDEYLAHVGWGSGPLTVLVQPRDQRAARVMTADSDTGRTQLVREWHDDAWVELVPGSPAWLGDRLVTVEDRPLLGEGGTRVVCVDGEPVTPAGLQVRELLVARPGPGATASTGLSGVVVFAAAPHDDPTCIEAYEMDLDRPGRAPVVTLSDGREPTAGMRQVVPGRPPVERATVPSVEISRSLGDATTRVTVVWEAEHGRVEHQLPVVAQRPVITARPRMLELGPRRLRAALFVPAGDHASASLPVLLDPYGGPHAQRVVAAQTAHLTSQWLADQGFAVLVVDGRGSPARGPVWERALRHDLATAVLEDQVDALHAAATLDPRLDLSRVAVRGWSFGGYLAAMAVLRRPDVFHAAIAGAPVTDWRLYDTHYTERYLGHPDRESDAYDVSSLVDGEGRLSHAAPWDPDLPPALLLIHGLADDNVVAAHSLRLSSALLADGRPHQFLPLSGVTHMTPQETVAEHLLTQQVAFLDGALRRRP